MNISFPSLPLVQSLRLSHEYSGLTVEALSDRWSTGSESSFFYPTAVTRATEAQLLTVRENCVSIAKPFGFPTRRPSRNFSKFDQAISVALYDDLNIIPADAARDEVWSFITLILLPDVAHWRFPNPNRRPDYDRIIGRPRNVFRRLWWRAYCLGPEVSAQLYEDEAVAIMERPTFGGDRAVASAIATTHLAVVAGVSGLRRTDYLRQVMKRLSRLAPMTTFSESPKAIMHEVIYDAFLLVLTQLGYEHDQHGLRSAWQEVHS